MICTQGLLPTHQCSLVHLLCLPQLPLVSVEIRNVVKCKRVEVLSGPRAFFATCQRLLVHVLCLFQLPLVSVEIPKAVDCVESGCMIWAQGLDELPRRSIAPDPNGTVEDSSGDLRQRFNIAAIIEPLRPIAKWTGIATGNHASSPRTLGSGIADPNPVDPK
jgi:hypothetical protein